MKKKCPICNDRFDPAEHRADGNRACCNACRGVLASIRGLHNDSYRTPEPGRLLRVEMYAEVARRGGTLFEPPAEPRKGASA